ncbi:PorP/SprF family type IX secretion system membrane protein [Spirosoma luteum]|uniref:PorP/SprF family type IX secretion system membrane protein n=1 Tax=Spirosoma luteum TaxID=431553 RepID=UPI0003665750|nr:type IX secretion system membrane protein PorP/SprF [Spirosoma luteum]
MSTNFSTKHWAGMLLLILGFSSSQVRAQQDKMFSQYMFNMMALNPAYAGSRDVLSMSALYRNQWTGLPGAPQTATFTADMPLNNERVGVGIQLYGDKIGVLQEAGGFASYAFRIKVGARSTLALGLQAGASSYQLNLTEVRTSPDGQIDPAFASNISKILPNFGTGIYLSNDRSYLSLSVPRLVKNKLSEYNVGNYRSVQARQAYLAAGFVVGITPGIKMKPSMLIKYADGAPLGFDGNINFWFADRIAIGASIRRNQFSSWSKYTTDAVVGMLEIQLNDQFRFGYAYDHTMNNLQSVAPSSHEIMIRYEFGFGKNRILTPRYF